MGTKAFRNVRLLCAIAMLSFVWPAVAQVKKPASASRSKERLARISVTAATPSRSGISFGKRFAVVVNAERSHVPTDVTFFQDGYSATRGATTRFVSGEFRYVPVTYKNASHPTSSSVPTHAAHNQIPPVIRMMTLSVGSEFRDQCIGIRRLQLTPQIWVRGLELAQHPPIVWCLPIDATIPRDMRQQQGGVCCLRRWRRLWSTKNRERHTLDDR